MTYQFKNMDGYCDECACELWFGQSEAPHADLCSDCYHLEIINGECEAPTNHPTYTSNMRDEVWNSFGNNGNKEDQS